MVSLLLETRFSSNVVITLYIQRLKPLEPPPTPHPFIHCYVYMKYQKDVIISFSLASFVFVFVRQFEVENTLVKFVEPIIIPSH
jgi:hypothetical protein